MPRWLSLWRLLCPTYLSDYIHLGSPKMWLGRWSCCFFFWGFQKGWSWGWVDTQKKTTKHFWALFRVFFVVLWALFLVLFVVLYKLNIFCHCMCSMVYQSGVQLQNDVISSDPIILFCKCLLLYPTCIWRISSPLIILIPYESYSFKTLRGETTTATTTPSSFF